MDDEALTRRAFRAYFQRFGEYADQPGNRSGYVQGENGRSYVVLVNGIWDVLAVYSVRAGEKLRFMRRWPADLGRTRNGACHW
jgi:hypothetical protein